MAVTRIVDVHVGDVWEVRTSQTIDRARVERLFHVVAGEVTLGDGGCAVRARWKVELTNLRTNRRIVRSPCGLRKLVSGCEAVT